jgi:hypothetical protein
MKKFGFILGGGLAAAAAIYLAIAVILGSLVTSSVNLFGPRLAHTKVTLGGAWISPFSGGGRLDDLVVGNPAGWSQGDAIALKRIRISAAPASLLSDHVVINELEIDHPEFLYETRFVRSNLGDLVRQIEGGKDEADAQAQTRSGATRRFEIKHLIVRNGRIRLAVAGAPGVVLTMPTFEFQNLGSTEGGVNSAELAGLVAAELLESVAKSAASAVGKVGKTGLGAAGDWLRGAAGLFKHQ